MLPEIIQKYNRPVPRYTSYPPANYFVEFSEADYLCAVKASDTALQNHISFYLHIPFCRRLCHYCGCNSYPAAAPEIVEAYVGALHREIDLVTRHIDHSRQISQIHYGGGSPTSIPIPMLKELNEHLLSIAPTIACPEIAIECHPGYLTEDDWQQLASCGFSRYSIGIQDLNEDVLKAVKRRPSQLPLQDILQILKSSGATVNFDFIYGLPLQTVDSFRKTIEQAAQLRPDRLVTFSYAHLPRLFPRQQILDRIGLPATEEKSKMYETASKILKQAGYQRIGLDHFVLPDDELYTALQTGRLHRNFQGYCSRRTTAQVYAFGVTGISQLDDAYAQNGRDIKTYIETIDKDNLYICCGYHLSAEQKLIREVVEALMCNYTLDWNDVAQRTGASVAQLQKACNYDKERLRVMASDGILVFDDNRITVNTDGRPLVRCVAAALDPLMRHTDKHFSNPI